jgi:hypothetical protein
MTELDGKALLKADLATGVVIALLGLAVLIVSLGMPSLADRGVNPLTAPGIFPTVIGAVLVLCGALLAIRSLAAGGSGARTAWSRAGAGRILGTLVLMLVAVALVGRIDFRLVAGGFTLAFVAVFLDWRLSGRALARRLVAVAITVAVTAIIIPALFESVFLVRLP